MGEMIPLLLPKPRFSFPKVPKLTRSVGFLLQAATAARDEIRLTGRESVSVWSSPSSGTVGAQRTSLTGLHRWMEGTGPDVEPERYGELTDEFEQMFSAESSPVDGTVIVCDRYAASIYVEMLRYLVTSN